MAVIASMHLADIGSLRSLAVLARSPRPDRTPGLVYADTLLTAQLSAGLRPRPVAGRVALFAVWRDEAALDRFVAEDPLAERLASGPAVRLAPLRCRGSWRGLPELVNSEQPVADDEPVAVLTYGRLKPHRTLAFLRASARAEADAIADGAMLAGTGLTRPPRLVSTFSLWRSAAEMRDFAHHQSGHADALRAVAERDFHRESIFIRFRPYGATGEWAAAL
jgi:hypothetical protein